MKTFLLFFFFVVSSSLNAQRNGAAELPSGTYETVLKKSQHKWNHGDIILMDGNHYKITSSDELGEYKFSATAQRIIFISGPLKTAFAKTVFDTGKPIIILPLAENEQQGLKLVTGDVIACFKN